MLAPIPSLILFLAALVLILLRISRPHFRYSWLLSVVSAAIAAAFALGWPSGSPATLSLGIWPPQGLQSQSVVVRADSLSGPIGAAMCIFALSAILMSPARNEGHGSLTWAGILGMAGLGVLAAIAGDALTLVLTWTAIDFVELASDLRSLRGANAGRRAVGAFFGRMLASLLLLRASFETGSIAGGAEPGQVGEAFVNLTLSAIILRLAAVLTVRSRIPNHEKRGMVETTVQVVAAAAGLRALANIGPGAIMGIGPAVFLVLISVMAVYAGWTWLRTPARPVGRPFWLAGMGCLAAGAALRGEPIATSTWITAMVLGGGAFLLPTVSDPWVTRLLMLGAFALSALPYSLTFGGWAGTGPSSAPLAVPLIATQALLLAGYLQRQLSSYRAAELDDRAAWNRSAYRIGAAMLLASLVGLGLRAQVNAPLQGNGAMAAGVVLIAGGALVFNWRRPALAPPAIAEVPATHHRTEALVAALRGIDHALGRASNATRSALEGEGAVIWTLLFLVVLMSLFAQAAP